MPVLPLIVLFTTTSVAGFGAARTRIPPPTLPATVVPETVVLPLIATIPLAPGPPVVTLPVIVLFVTVSVGPADETWK